MILSLVLIFKSWLAIFFEDFIMLIHQIHLSLTEIRNNPNFSVEKTYKGLSAPEDLNLLK